MPQRSHMMYLSSLKPSCSKSAAPEFEHGHECSVALVRLKLLVALFACSRVWFSGRTLAWHPALGLIPSAT